MNKKPGHVMFVGVVPAGGLYAEPTAEFTWYCGCDDQGKHFRVTRQVLMARIENLQALHVETTQEELALKAL